MHEKHGEETKFFHVRKYSRQKMYRFPGRPPPISLTCRCWSVDNGGRWRCGDAIYSTIVHLAYTIYPFLLPSNNNKFRKGGDKCSFINNTICLDCKRLAVKQHNVIFYNSLSPTRKTPSSSFRPRRSRDISMQRA